MLSVLTAKIKVAGAQGNFWRFRMSITLIVGMVSGYTHMFKLIKLYTLNMHSFLYTNYTSLKLFFKKKQKEK